jgi:hypothetical protein
MSPDEHTALLQRINDLNQALLQAREVIFASLNHRKVCQGQMQETPLATLHRAWRLVDPHERLCFLIEMTTPQERRALATGLDAEEAS